MKTLAVCVRSSCHLLGSYAVIKRITTAFGRTSAYRPGGTESQFLFGSVSGRGYGFFRKCLYTALTEENIDAFFYQHVLADVDEAGRKGKRDGDHLDHGG